MSRKCLMAVAMAAMGLSVGCKSAPRPAACNNGPDPRAFATSSGERSSTEFYSRPGMPDRIRQRNEQWYDGPVTGAPAGSAPRLIGETGSAPRPIGELPMPQKLPSPTPLPPSGPPAKGTGLSAPPSGLLLPPVAAPQPSSTARPASRTDLPEDDEIPRIGKIRVYGITPDGKRVPGRRYDANGRLIENDDDDDGPSLLPPGVPTITPPPGPLPALPTVPVPPPPAKPSDPSRTT